MAETPVAVGDPTAVDQVAIVHDWLKDHPANADLLGGPSHVSGIAERPWPHVVASDGPGGDLRDLIWSTEVEVTIEVIGHPNGAPGQTALRQLAAKQVQLARELPDREAHPGIPVVSRVRPSGVFVWAPLSNGQPRYIVGVLVVAHPPIS